jgi:MFS family permease
MGVLRTNKTFRWLVIARAVNVVGNSVAPIALAFAVLDMGATASQLGLVVGARSLANVIFLLAGGVLADRVPRNVVLAGSMGTAFLSQAAVTVLIVTGDASIGALIALSAVNGIAGAFALPAAAALMGQVIPDEGRREANSINAFATRGAMIIGAGLGGLLVATLGPGVGLAADTVSFAIAGVLYSLVPRKPVTKPKAHPLADLREGWRELIQRPWLWAVVLGFSVFNAVYTGAFNVLGPVLADTSFGRHTWGFVIAGHTGGMVLGAVIAMKLKVRRPLLLGMTCMFAEPLMILSLAKASPPVIVAAALVAGIGLQQFSVAWEMSMQTHVPQEKLARVYSWDMLGSFMAIPIGTALAGPIAAAVGVREAIVGGAVLSAFTIAAVLASRSVRRLTVKPYPVGV